MTELDVTYMVERADEMIDLSGSAAEHGSNAGPWTWGNSVEWGRDHPLLTTDEQREAARRHFRAYGAWDADEIAAWTEDELQGITCQEVAAAIREREAYEDEDTYRDAGSGRLGKGDDGRWYFYLGE